MYHLREGPGLKAHGVGFTRENGWETMEDTEATLTLFSGCTNTPSKSRRKAIPIVVPNGTLPNKIIFAESVHVLSYEEVNKGTGWTKGSLSGHPPYLLPHVDEE